MVGSRKIKNSKIRLSWGLDIVGRRDPTRRDLVPPHSNNYIKLFLTNRNT
jgi:hypothetical protein